MKIKLKLNSTIVLFVISFVVLQNVILLTVLYSSSRSDSLDNMNRISEIGNFIDDWVCNHKVAITSDMTAVSLIYNDHEAVMHYLLERQRLDDQIINIYFTSVNSVDDGGFILISAIGFVPPPGFNHTLRPWFTAAAASNTAIISEPYIDAVSGAMVFTFARRVYNLNGE